MKPKIALLILYNHKFEKNIERLKDLYKGKFTYIYQLIPFYEGSDPSVIPVYGSSYFFQTFISQAYSRLKGDGFTHYFVVADDMLLNPILTENNLFSQLGISEQDAFISNLQALQKMQTRLVWMKNALKYRIKQKGLEIENILPSKEIAKLKFKEYGLPTGCIPVKYFFQIKRRSSLFYSILYNLRDFVKDIPFLFHRSLEYPIVKAYSDILLVPADNMNKFATYCGAFASSGLFVELAVPTSMVLSVEKDHIKTCADTKLKYGAIWTNEEMTDLTCKYNYSLEKLLDDYPEGTFFLHPIKLSKWV